jgi:acetylornithine deacetylase/succinyl-diaminopimelate desuccinylase-like protein
MVPALAGMKSDSIDFDVERLALNQSSLTALILGEDAEGNHVHGLNECMRMKSLMEGRRFLYEVGLDGNS